MKIKKLKKCYIALSDNILTKANIELIKRASKLGLVYVGLLSDKSINEYKKAPALNYKTRHFLISNLKNVYKVVEQSERDYSKNLNSIKPDYVFHKKNKWSKGIQKETREKLIKNLKKWSGKLIEYDLSKHDGDFVFDINKEKKSIFKRLIDSKRIIRILESHSPLSALIIDKLKYTTKNSIDEFDGLWCSSLADSVTRGKPDNQTVDLSTRIESLNDVMEITSKPILFDADNGGSLEQLPYLIRNMERMGIAGIVMEDKKGLKINSLFSDQTKSSQDSIKNFSKKLKLASKSRISNDLQIIARIESFILGNGLGDAIRRAEAYSKAGADMILIHSKSKKPDEIFEFSKIFSKSKYFKPMICIPSTYSSTSEEDLIKNNFKVVIYANQLLRSVYPAMIETATSILKYKKSSKAEKKISSVKDIINLIELNDNS